MVINLQNLPIVIKFLKATKLRWSNDVSNFPRKPQTECILVESRKILKKPVAIFLSSIGNLGNNILNKETQE